MNVWWLPGFLALTSDPLPIRARVVSLHTLCQPGGVEALAHHVGPEDVLVGYSMGGRVALAAVAAGLRPAALILVSASPGLGVPTARTARRDLDLARATSLEVDPSEFLAAWRREPIFAGAEAAPLWQGQQEARAALVAHELAAHGHSPWARAQAEVLRTFSPGLMAPMWDALPSLPTRTLWIAGARDGAYVEAAHVAAARMPDAEAAIVPGAGHALPLEAPEALAQLLESFTAAARRKPQEGVEAC